MNNSPYDRLVEKCVGLDVPVSSTCLVASIPEQRLCLFVDGKILNAYPMSSSKKPPSCIEDSFGTPWGLHEVCEKIGKGEPKGMVFEGRVPIRLCYWECESEKQEKSLITTRILRLHGLEPGVNRGGDRDTYARMVYLHGTNHEEKIGQPASAGCLQLSNDDVMELYELVPTGALLLIEKEF